MLGQDIVPDGSAGFYTPPRKGQIWDTWMYYYDGTYYLGGKFVKWDTHELATSIDGVNWEALPPLKGDMHGEFGGIDKCVPLFQFKGIPYLIQGLSLLY